MHLWRSGTYAVCNLWQCGTPNDPSEFAVFDSTESSALSKCKACFGRAVLELLPKADSVECVAPCAEDFDEPDVVDSVIDGFCQD